MPSPSLEEKQIEEGLEAIYGDDKVDFTKMDRGRSRLTSILLTVVVTLAVIALTAWTAFFVYSQFFSSTEEEGFNLVIETEESVVSGEETTITIRYENPTTVPLASLELDVNLPGVFQPEQFTPVPDDAEEFVWDIGSVAAGSDGSIVLTGTWIAEVPSSTPIQVFASYRPANFNADFSEIETIYVDTVNSVVEAAFEGPEEGKPGETLDYKIEVRNTGSETLENAQVTLALPDGFFLEESEPAIPSGEAPVWTFDTLEALEEATITFSGSFAADREGFHYFTVETLLRKDETQASQITIDGFTDVLRHDLSLQLVANGTPDDVTVALNDNLRLSVALENGGGSTVSDADLLLDFQSEATVPLIWADADLDGASITSDGIYWSSDQIGDMAPGEKIQFNVSIPVDANVGNGQSDLFTIVASSSSDTFEIRSSPIEISIATEADFEARARYYDDAGTPLGSGPMPPVVGETTEYRLYWSIENSLHDLENVKVEATLPPHVEWVGVFHTDLGSITYDTESRTMSWEISTMPTSLNRVEANAAIKTTPDQDDLGTFLKLVSGSTFKATDSVTQTVLTESTESLDSELIGDEFAEGEGVVVEILE